MEPFVGVAKDRVLVYKGNSQSCLARGLVSRTKEEIQMIRVSFELAVSKGPIVDSESSSDESEVQAR